MSETQLDAFLKEDEPAPVAETPPPAPEPEPKAEPAPKPETDDDEPIPVAAEGEPAVPRRALEDERHKRQNYAVQAAKFEAERDMLAKQLEELKKSPPPQPVAREPLPPIDPSVDPEGYHRRVIEVQLNAQLNNSEMLVRDKLGDEAVDAAVVEFKQAAEADPTLFNKLYQQKHPYGWLIKEVERQRLQREVGDDPVKWRETERERIRKEIEAERGAQPAERVSPVAGLPPSLANVRSAAGRSAPADTGDMSLDDLVKDIRAAAVRRK